jgi:hypothetical protein
MATAQEKSEVSDEQLAALLDRAVNARGEKEWREKVEKAGGTLRAGIFVLEGAEKMTGAPECSSLCRTPSIRPGWVSLERGSGFEKHPGDSEAGSDFRF